jgi:very-short-patch-repair endonuclease
MSHLEDKLYGDLMMSSKVPLPKRQYKFHPTRRWLIDLAWPGRKLGVEVDGGTWSGGRHTRGQGYENDCEKLNEAAIWGWTMLRVTGKMVDDGRALTYIERMFDE